MDNGHATSTVKSNYFRFETITLKFMRNDLSLTVGIHTIG